MWDAGLLFPAGQPTFRLHSVSNELVIPRKRSSWGGGYRAGFSRLSIFCLWFFRAVGLRYARSRGGARLSRRPNARRGRIYRRHPFRFGLRHHRGAPSPSRCRSAASPHRYHPTNRILKANCRSGPPGLYERLKCCKETGGWRPGAGLRQTDQAHKRNSGFDDRAPGKVRAPGRKRCHRTGCRHFAASDPRGRRLLYRNDA
jgi:hypothetical protein